MIALLAAAVGCLPKVDFTPCSQRDTCPITDASDATNDLPTVDAREGGADVSDASDSSDAADAADATDVIDAADAADATDVIDAADAADATDVVDAAADVVDAAADVTCGASERNCGGVCRGVQDDPLNCGACGRSCRADQVCASGACECAAARSECGGACRNLTSDPSNCGVCGRVCTSGLCASGACGCTSGQTDCGGACRNLTNDAANCGRCGVVCRSGSCVAGACVPEQRSCVTAGTPGCGLVEIAGGTFSMGADVACTGAGTDPLACALNGSPVQPMITVSSFAVDAFEVSVARFRAFWSARASDGGASNRARPVAYPGGHFITWDAVGNEPTASGTGPCNWSRAAGTREAHPINCIDWRIAMEFCVWDGGRLPTEAEWEFAARGRAVPEERLTSGRIFPWGDETSTRTCDQAQVLGCPGDDSGITRRVGSFSASGGVFDLAGNVEEWTASDNVDYSNASCWSQPRQTDPFCSGVSPTTRITRGGSLNSRLPRSASRSWASPLSPMAFTGFRCVRNR